MEKSESGTPGVYLPNEWYKFPADMKIYWHVHRMGEHHNQPIWMQGYDKKRFILIGHDALGFEQNAIFIVPDSVQTVFEFLLTRGRLEYAKSLGLIFDELLSFKDADIVSARPSISVDEKYLFPHKHHG